MSNSKCYKLPSSAHALARKVYADMAALMVERATLLTDYAKACADLESRFHGPSMALVMKINEAKLKGSEALCHAIGIPYNPDCGYSIDTTYLDDLGVAFIQEVQRENGSRFDGIAEDLPPPGTKLN